MYKKRRNWDQDLVESVINKTDLIEYINKIVRKKKIDKKDRNYGLDVNKSKKSKAILEKIISNVKLVEY